MLPDRSILIRQKLAENDKIENLKYETFWVIFKHCAWAKKSVALQAMQWWAWKPKAVIFKGCHKAKQFTLSDANHFECKHYLLKNAKKDSKFPGISKILMVSSLLMCYPILALMVIIYSWDYYCASSSAWIVTHISWWQKTVSVLQLPLFCYSSLILNILQINLLS